MPLSRFAADTELVRAHGDLLDEVAVASMVQLLDGTVQHANATAERLLGLGPLEGRVLDAATWPLRDAEGRPLAAGERPMDLALQHGRVATAVVGHLAGGQVAWLRLSCLPTKDATGRAQQLLTTFVDVTAMHAPRGLSLSSVSQVQAIIDATPVGICVTDEDGVYESVNPAYERLYGYRSEELVGRPFTVVVPPEGRVVLQTLHDRFIAEGAEVRGEWQVLDRAGRARTVLADACRVVGADGRFRKVTFVIDISDRKTLEHELARVNQALAEMAFHDSLTGLANHRAVVDTLERAARTAARYGRVLTVAVLDLDLFKVVNDTHGHPVGDEVLVAFAGLLAAGVRDSDVVGRSGGEEFVVVMPETTADEAVEVLARLHSDSALLEVSVPGVAVTFSAGVTELVAGDDVESMIERADRALYRAKENGRAQTQVAARP